MAVAISIFICVAYPDIGKATLAAMQIIE